MDKYKHTDQHIHGYSTTYQDSDTSSDIDPDSYADADPQTHTHTIAYTHTSAFESTYKHARTNTDTSSITVPNPFYERPLYPGARRSYNCPFAEIVGEIVNSLVNSGDDYYYRVDHQK